jgi:hypothetical protein
MGFKMRPEADMLRGGFFRHALQVFAGFFFIEQQSGFADLLQQVWFHHLAPHALQRW